MPADIDSPQPQRVGIVGLGRVGEGLAACLIRRGRRPAVFDIRVDAARGLGADVVRMASARELAETSDVIIVAVVDARQVEDVLSGHDGVLAGADSGVVVVLVSTVSVSDVLRLASLARAGGVGLVDCGITPGSRAASHEIVAMLGGDQADVETARPVVDDFAKAAFHCGPLGSGMTMKLARNVVTYGAWRAVHEAAELVVGAGLALRTLLDVIDLADPQGSTPLRLLRTALADGSTDPSSDRLADALEVLMAKDLQAAIDRAEELGVGLPLVAVALEHTARTAHRRFD